MNGTIQRSVRILASVLVIALAVAAAPGPRPAPAVPAVVLLTMDGVRWDYPQREALPAFSSMAAAGWTARRLTPPFPSRTFPSHSTLATGASPARHGIVANNFLDRASGRRFSDEREASWLEVPPLWALAERAGLKAAVRSWPCSQGAWNGTAPSFFQGYDGDARDGETVSWILGLLHRPAPDRPRLIMAWTRGADHAGHGEGPDSEGVRKAMREADRLLAGLRAGIAALGPSTPVDLLVVSDHGMAPVNRMVDVVKVIPKAGYYPFIATSGPLCNVYVKTEAQRRAVAASLGRLPQGILSMTRAEVEKRFGYGGDRMGDFVLLCPPGATFASFSRKGDRDVPRGMHGYDPSLPDMGGIFYAEGPQFPSGKTLAEVRAADIAPTVCAVLRIPPPPSAAGRNLLVGSP